MKAIQSNPRKRTLPDGYMCFTLDGSSHAHRSSYSNERREQVHEVRKVGACLRCQLLKKSCSKGEPCTTCLRAAAKTSASRSLAWMDCIRPSLLNVTIYGSNAHFDPDLRLGGIPVLQYLAHDDVDLKFDIPFQWNIDELSAFVAGWLVNDHDAPRASMVGIMSSASLLSAISDLVGSELAQVFKALLYTSSLIFNSSNGRVVYSEKSNDIRILRHCGHRLLLHLETHIKPTALARLKKHELYALFLMLLGCIISSKYVAESLGDLSRLSSHFTSSATRQQVQPATTMHSDLERGSELIRLLSHQMVYVGHCTGLLQEGMDKNLIEDLTAAQWRKKAFFTWEQAEMDANPPTPVSLEIPAIKTYPDPLANYESQVEEENFGFINPPQQPPHFRSQRFSDRLDNRNLPLMGGKRSQESHDVLEQRRRHHENKKRTRAEPTAEARARVAQLREMKSCVSCWKLNGPQVRLVDIEQTSKQMKFCETCSYNRERRHGVALDDRDGYGIVNKHVRLSDEGSTAAEIEWAFLGVADNASPHPSVPAGDSGESAMPSCKATMDSRFVGEIVDRCLKYSVCRGSRSTLNNSKHVKATTSPWTADHEQRQLNYNTERPPPFDFDVAAFDPTLPTHDIDLFSFLAPDNTELWPCLNRVPTPPPEPDPELEEQMKDFELSYADWLSGEGSGLQNFTTPNTAAPAGRCSTQIPMITPELDSPFHPMQKRLLL